MSGHMEISVYWWFQVPGEPRERVTHASQSEFWLVFSLIIFLAMPAENVWPLCSKSAHSQVSAALFYVRTIHLCWHGSVQMIRRLLACKQRIGDANSVKTLVWQSPGLPDLAAPWLLGQWLGNIKWQVCSAKKFIQMEFHLNED